MTALTLASTEAGLPTSPPTLGPSLFVLAAMTEALLHRIVAVRRIAGLDSQSASQALAEVSDIRRSIAARRYH